MEDIVWFKDLKKTDISIAGGKGANLGEMFAMNLPVPNGFAISAGAYKRFLDYNHVAKKIYSILQGLDVENNSLLQSKANEIQKLIVELKIPDDLKDKILEAYEYIDKNKELFDKLANKNLDIFRAGRELPLVAVRSSATAEDLPEASFAGQQATFLNVKGKQQILDAVKKCWASLFTARAIYYRIKNNFPHEKVFISVLVQKQIQSQKAGVIFTVNPLNNNDKEIMIEACYGLGESIVSGSISPDQYILDKTFLRVISKKMNRQEWMFKTDVNLKQTIKRNVPEDLKYKQILSDHEIRALGEFAKIIEKHYEIPQDIEYAVESGQIYIVQSRPITTLNKGEEREAEQVEKGAEKILKGLAASPGVASGKVKIVKDKDNLDKVEKGDILVTIMTTPDYVPAMKRAVAIITDEGGATAHAAIVSREMGIPCVVGTEKATHILKDDEIVTVDGTAGVVYKGSVSVQHKEEHYETVKTKVKVKTLVDMPDFAEKSAKTGSEGVGLVRLEIMIADGKIHPRKYIEDNKKEAYIDLIYRGVKKIAGAFKGKPVWIRTSDLRTDEYRNLEGGDEEAKEDNPMLGCHGIRRGLRDLDILRCEFMAFKQLHDEGLNNVGVMIPFVINVDELKKSKEIMREVGLEPVDEIDFGVMIETPASVWIIEELCKEKISFISFGTNDLTQLTLGVDRNNEVIADLFNEMHPSVLKQMKFVIDICKKYNVETSICGQAGSNAEMASFLVKAGIDSISVNPDAVNKIKHFVSEAEHGRS
ncbi:MAG: phosphoenolpyruvate synthase [Candidatus Nanoarchaeia archaeon]|nr:phosphoenolpyruvate synthase [Candidatus Nanoarchaeia archaeon]